MTHEEFLEKIEDLIGKYTYGNSQYEDVDDGGTFSFSDTDECFCWVINIEKR